jgi:hypothetical protein
MTWWGVFVLAVIAVPVVSVICLSVADARHNRRIRASPSRSVDGIRERVEREHAEQAAANAQTEVLPVIQPASDDEPTVRLPPVARSKRSRCYAQRPDPELMWRVLDGLRKLPDASPPRTKPPEPDWPHPDPDD